jgi:Transglutaminase-like superfamily
MFNYSLNYHSNDVLDMILNFSEAQCADDASILTSLLRCAGIPAHNVSADAALETGAANWTFDTWIEFLASHGGSTEWRVLHPHEYPGMTPESRSTFGTTRGVATKDFNDLIIMANETWVSADLDDGIADISFTRNSCQEPDQRILKASWIDELCEGGYWLMPHWDCTGVRSRSLRSVKGVQFSKSEVFFDDQVSGTVDVVNKSTDRIVTDLTTELIGTMPESKAFPNALFDKSTSISLGLNGGESSSLSFDLKIPPSLEPGNLLYLWLHAGPNKETIALQELPVSPGMTCEVSAPRDVQVGDSHVITATVSNASNKPLTNVAVELRTPFAAEMQDKPRQELQTLEPGQKGQVSWTVKGIAALRSGSNIIQVSSGNAGGLKIHRPIRVLGGEPVVKTLPALKASG